MSRLRAPFFVLAITLAAAASVPSRGVEAGRYTPEGSHVTVIAPRARLSLRLARLAGEILALRCLQALPKHGGMLLALHDWQHPTAVSPHYYYAHVDEMAVDEAGRVLAGVLDVPPREENGTPYRRAFLVKARYIIDVPAGEALEDGLIPGQRVRIIADPQSLEAEADHSLPAPRPCPQVS